MMYEVLALEYAMADNWRFGCASNTDGIGHPEIFRDQLKSISMADVVARPSVVSA